MLRFKNIAGPRGIYAEAATLKRLKSEKLNPGGTPELTVDPNSIKTGDRIPEGRYKGKEGIDIEGTTYSDSAEASGSALMGNRPVGVEVKNYTASTAGSVLRINAKGTSSMSRQAEKHFATKIDSLLDDFDDVTRKTSWLSDAKPHLHYDLHGGAWKKQDGSDRSHLTNLKKQIIDLCENRKEKKAGKDAFRNAEPAFDCQKDITFHVNEYYPEPLTSKP